MKALAASLVGDGALVEVELPAVIEEEPDRAAV
jgi:hypothetical protein